MEKKTNFQNSQQKFEFYHLFVSESEDEFPYVEGYFPTYKNGVDRGTATERERGTCSCHLQFDAAK